MTITLTPNIVLAAIALVSGVLLLVPGGQWSRLPLPAIAIIALALNQLGIIR